MKHKPKYSGPGKTGVCVCGHSVFDHHLGVVMNVAYYEQTQEAYVPQECEFYGCNKEGGMMPGPDGEWIDHCFGYQDSGVQEEGDTSSDTGHTGQERNDSDGQKEGEEQAPTPGEKEGDTA